MKKWLLAPLLFLGCNLEHAPVEITPPAVEVAPTKPGRLIDIEALRREKDRSFLQDEDSPLPAEERHSFKGLKYYPLDTAYTVKARLNKYPSPETVKMLTSTGEQREYLRYGYFEFVLSGTECRLDVFKQPGSNLLFIPFRDVTSGKETYGAGRYLDLQESTTDDLYILDFNLAYNPYCAYNSRYSCPIPPPQNTLKVAIRAGEKSYH
ncbi:MAG: DUF1684 domain-containing protein [Acidobacteriota bacterium]|nr:DUF1684 domain-containing protein [Blastocatellia bacterium]MDW8411451.1 DUF1684 domain-containing protein [Acidobacteriota bacterium]